MTMRRKAPVAASGHHSMRFHCTIVSLLSMGRVFLLYVLLYLYFPDLLVASTSPCCTSCCPVCPTVVLMLVVKHSTWSSDPAPLWILGISLTLLCHPTMSQRSPVCPSMARCCQVFLDPPWLPMERWVRKGEHRHVLPMLGVSRHVRSSTHAGPSLGPQTMEGDLDRSQHLFYFVQHNQKLSVFHFVRGLDLELRLTRRV